MARNRAGSRLSFRRSSSSSIPRIEATESPQEKHRFQVRGKADPSKAINEAEPAAVATSEVTLGRPLRDMEHRDQEGNIIVDPDRSNPTRPRLERPLDTIRSFEAAIDGSYYRRQSYRAETPNPMASQARRSSYLNGPPPPQRRGLSENGGSSADRQANGRPDSYYDNGASPSAAYYGGTNRRFGPRNNSDPALYGSNHNANPTAAIYPTHGHQQSYDTVGGTSSGSHVTEPWGNSTDPSSENSSIDRIQPPPKTDLGEAYGFNGFGGGPQFGGPILEEYGHGDPGYGQPGYGNAQMANGGGQYYQGNSSGPPPVPQHLPPAPPPKDAAASSRTPIRPVPHNVGTRRRDYNSRPALPSNEKRKSWIKKRFSRS